MTPFAVIAPATARNILLAFVGGCYLAYHLYHLWRWWRGNRKEVVSDKEKARGEGEQRNLPGSEGTVGASVPSAHHFSDRHVGERSSVDMQSKDNEKAVFAEDAGRSAIGPYHPTAQQVEAIHRSPSPQSSNLKPQTLNLEPLPSLSGEELYAQARAMPHRPIPDGRYDGEYLKTLAKSAELGYPRAMAKLGDYAMRRGCNVEAYYWLWRAKKGGTGNLDRTLLQVRSAWANGGFRRESANEYEGFSHEQGTVGYALLCIDARHNADAAKARLAECAPEFLD